MISANIKKDNNNFLDKVKGFFKKNLTGKQMNSIKNIYYKLHLNSKYKYDKSIYSRYSFGLTTKEYSLDNLRGKITLHYHSIEKGMSIENGRLGFGKRAFTDLFYSMDKYIELEYPADDERFLSAINIMEAYIKYHDEQNYDVSPIKQKFAEYEKYAKDKKFKTVKANRVFNKKEIDSIVDSSFDKFSRGRVSVRNYSSKPVELQLIEEAIEIAMDTPSVCNRQPWNVYIVNTYDTIQDVLNIQLGLNEKERTEIKLLLAVTVDVSYYANDKERNEPFVDGGLFSMSLLYSLHHKGLAACALNANQSNSGQNEELALIGAGESERLILFISVGNYQENFTVPLSSRDDYKNHLIYV